MNFWRGVFSDGDQPSFSRIATGMIVAFSLGWVTHLVWHNHTLPDTMTMAGLTAFMVSPYALNAAKNAATSFSPTNGQNSGVK